MAGVGALVLLASILVSHAGAQEPVGDHFVEQDSIEGIVGARDLVFSQEYDRLVVKGDNSVEIYDSSSGELSLELLSDAAVGDIDLTPDGRYLFVVKSRRTGAAVLEFVQRVDLATGAMATARFGGLAREIVAVTKDRLVRRDGNTIWLEAFDGEAGSLVPLAAVELSNVASMGFDPESSSIIIRRDSGFSHGAGFTEVDIASDDFGPVASTLGSFSRKYEQPLIVAGSRVVTGSALRDRFNLSSSFVLSSDAAALTSTVVIEESGLIRDARRGSALAQIGFSVALGAPSSDGETAWLYDELRNRLVAVGLPVVPTVLTTIESSCEAGGGRLQLEVSGDPHGPQSLTILKSTGAKGETSTLVTNGTLAPGAPLVRSFDGLGDGLHRFEISIEGVIVGERQVNVKCDGTSRQPVEIVALADSPPIDGFAVAPKTGRTFAFGGQRLLEFDAEANLVAERMAPSPIVDLSFSPDGDFLFLLEAGRIERLELASGEWTSADVARTLLAIEAVSGERVVASSDASVVLMEFFPQIQTLIEMDTITLGYEWIRRIALIEPRGMLLVGDKVVRLSEGIDGLERSWQDADPLSSSEGVVSSDQEMVYLGKSGRLAASPRQEVVSFPSSIVAASSAIAIDTHGVAYDIRSGGPVGLAPTGVSAIAVAGDDAGFWIYDEASRLVTLLRSATSPPIDVQLSVSCAAGSGAVSAVIRNNGSNRQPVVVALTGRTSPAPKRAEVLPGAAVTLRTTGRPDGVYTVIVSSGVEILRRELRVSCAGAVADRLEPVVGLAVGGSEKIEVSEAAGMLLLLSSPDELRLHDAATGTEIERRAPSGGFVDIAVTPSGRFFYALDRVASGSSVRASETIVHRFDVLTGEWGIANFEGDGRRIAAISADGLLLLEADTGIVHGGFDADTQSVLRRGSPESIGRPSDLVFDGQRGLAYAAIGSDVHVLSVDGDRVTERTSFEMGGRSGFHQQGMSNRMVLSSDGTVLFRGTSYARTFAVQPVSETSPAGPFIAAGHGVALDEAGVWWDTSSFEPLGRLGFEPGSAVVTADGTFWVHEADGRMVRRFDVGGLVDIAATVESSVQCSGEDGVIAVVVENEGSDPLPTTLSVTGSSDPPAKAVDVAPGDSVRLAISGRPDGTHLVAVRTGDRLFFRSFADVDCDVPPPLFNYRVSCAAGNGRLDVFLYNERQRRSSAEATLTGSNYSLTRRDSTSSIETIRLAWTGRPDGDAWLATWWRGQMRENLVRFDCDSDASDPATVQSTCLAGRGRLDLDVGNPSDMDAVATATLTGRTNLAPRELELSANQRGTITWTGRPDGNYTVNVFVGGREVAINASVSCSAASG